MVLAGSLVSEGTTLVTPGLGLQYLLAMANTVLEANSPNIWSRWSRFVLYQIYCIPNTPVWGLFHKINSNLLVTDPKRNQCVVNYCSFTEFALFSANVAFRVKSIATVFSTSVVVPHAAYVTTTASEYRKTLLVPCKRVVQSLIFGSLTPAIAILIAALRMQTPYFIQLNKNF